MQLLENEAEGGSQCFFRVSLRGFAKQGLNELLAALPPAAPRVKKMKDPDQPVFSHAITNRLRRSDAARLRRE